MNKYSRKINNFPQPRYVVKLPTIIFINNQKLIIMTVFKNFTPHTIALNSGKVYQSQGIARVSASFSSFDEDGVCHQVFGDLTGLPAPQDNVRYIVSALVLAAGKAQGRTDLVAPATGHPDCVRKDGFIVSVPGFVD